MEDLNRLIVFSDLDGTLLGHNDYRFDAARPLIGTMQKRGALIVLATSKTHSEVMQWQARLEIEGPFIVENGSAVYFTDGGHEVLGTPMQELESFLEPYAEDVTCLTSCSLEEAVALTGLSAEEAELAQARQFSIPFKLHRSVLEPELRKAAADQNLRVIKGGRFLHLQGQCDKSQAAELISSRYQVQSERRLIVMALGDNENDRTMLESANLAIVVNTDEGHQLELENGHTFYTKEVAPDGWCEGVNLALASLDEIEGGV